jgi:hypothetical protein
MEADYYGPLRGGLIDAPSVTSARAGEALVVIG